MASKAGYQSIEGAAGAGTSENDTKLSDVPETFLSKVKKVREENSGCCNFCMAFFALILGSLLWTFLVVVIITVPIVMIALGAEYLHECPVQKMIPICLLVAGCVLILNIGINCFGRFRYSSDSSMAKALRWTNVVLFFFWFAWIFATCYFVYGTNPDFNESVGAGSSNYCNPHLYGFVYWMLNFMFIFIGTFLVMSGLLMCIAMLMW